jgi:hypothetical protein
MSRKASSSTHRSLAVVSSSKTEVDTEKLNTFLIYYVYNIYEDAKNKVKKIDIENMIKTFNESMTRVCDIYMPMPKAKERHISRKSAEKPIIPDQKTLNQRFQELFAFLQPPLLKTLALLATLKPIDIYSDTRLFYVNMHGNYKFTNLHSLKKTVPYNVILVFNTPINRLSVCTNTKENDNIITKLQERESRYNILSQIGCVDKFIDIKEFDSSTLQFKTFMSRALVLYPGQFYYNIDLSYDKNEVYDVTLGVYEINETEIIYHDKDIQIKDTNLETLIEQKILSADKSKITYIFVDCCRSLDAMITSVSMSKRDESIKISSQIYEYEHFMYYFNLVMNSCRESVESYIPRSLYKHMRHEYFEDIIYDINNLLPNDKNEAKKIVAIMLKVVAKEFYHKKINEIGDQIIASFFKLPNDSYADDFNEDSITISDNVFEDCLNAFYKYILLNKFIKDDLTRQCLTLIINFIDNINGIIYMYNFAYLFGYALYPSYPSYNDNLISFRLNLVSSEFYEESIAQGLNNLEMVIKWFEIPLKNYDDFMELISTQKDSGFIKRFTLPPIFKDNYSILKIMRDDLINVLNGINNQINTQLDTLQDNFKGIKSYRILNNKPFDVDNYNYTYLYFYFRNLFNASVEAYIRAHPESMLSGSLILHKKSSMSRGSRSRSRAKQILTGQADLEVSKKIVKQLAIYSPISLQAGGRKLYRRKTKKYKNYIKLY